MLTVWVKHKKRESKQLTREGSVYVSNISKTYEKEEESEVVYFMINTTDDLIQTLRDNCEKNDEITVAHVDDGLQELFIVSKMAY